MPRRNRRQHNRRRGIRPVDVVIPDAPTPDQLAQSLVARGLASSQILTNTQTPIRQEPTR